MVLGAEEERWEACLRTSSQPADYPHSPVGGNSRPRPGRTDTVSSARARRPCGPVPSPFRLAGQSQEAPRAGFQGDASEPEAAGLALPRE